MPESMRLDWLYRFTGNDDYPDPVEEIDALCTLDANDEPTYLLLANRSSPPLSGASCGEVVGLCTSLDNRLILHGTAVVAGECIRCDTPPSVLPIYGVLSGRVFRPLTDLERLPSDGLSDTTLGHADQETFLKGQSFVKRLTSGTRTARKPAVRGPSKTDSPETMPTFPSLVFSQKHPAFTVVGLDPTAGTWDSRMAQGPKKMPSFALRWEGGFRPDDQPLVWHTTNDEFRSEVDRRGAILTCIDGPCGTNGPRLLRHRDPWCWDANAPKGTRGGELALSRQGINLFWTTQNTVMKFEGASRWIARSLVLLSYCPEQRKIETHPHGAFTFLWRLFGGNGILPKKSKPSGRNARLALLRSFVPGLSDGMVPNHDAVDAACAALIAGLHQLHLTTPFGSSSDGGQIWMPNCEQLAAFLPRSPEADDV
ncbi:MAG: DUF429 domain-containing protein [Pirellulaceae bacterium]|nr:DUF429 domain-containing protein [Pirellulaceae bacterium]